MLTAKLYILNAKLVPCKVPVDQGVDTHSAEHAIVYRTHYLIPGGYFVVP